MTRGKITSSPILSPPAMLLDSIRNFLSDIVCNGHAICGSVRRALTTKNSPRVACPMSLSAAARPTRVMPMLIPYGTTQHFAVFYDSTFTGGPGQVDGPALAQNVLDYCEYDLARLSMLFGNILPTSFPIA